MSDEPSMSKRQRAKRAEAALSLSLLALERCRELLINADAAADLAEWARKWREYRQPLIAPPKEHKRRELLEREAGVRLCNAALLWLWHQENPPSSEERVVGESSREANNE